MPAKIVSISDYEKKTQALVYPDHVAGIAVYDPDEDSDGVVVVTCNARDTASDIYLFPTPEGFVRQPDPNDLMEYCDAGTLITQIEHDEECHLETGSREGNVIEFVISHSLIMSDN
jgi:hypothetical protein